MLRQVWSWTKYFLSSILTQEARILSRSWNHFLARCLIEVIKPPRLLQFLIKQLPMPRSISLNLKLKESNSSWRRKRFRRDKSTSTYNIILTTLQPAIYNSSEGISSSARLVNSSWISWQVKAMLLFRLIDWLLLTAELPIMVTCFLIKRFANTWGPKCHHTFD